jgi:hypothetical protein
VAELLHEELETPGWHALNFHPPALPGGLYFVRLRAGRESLCRKLLLVN